MKRYRRLAIAAALTGVVLALWYFAEPSPHDVAGRGDVERLAKMLDRDPELVREWSWRWRKTPLHYAVTYRELGTAKLLIERGADVSSRDTTGYTPLHITSLFRRCDGAKLAELLLESGADITARDDFGDTPLHTAAIFGCGDVAKVLLEHGADPLSPNREGLTPAELARRYRNDEIAGLLDAAAKTGPA